MRNFAEDKSVPAGPLYGSDPWYHPAQAAVKDLRVYSRTLSPKEIRAVFRREDKQ
jgi:hypothetical protein